MPVCSQPYPQPYPQPPQQRHSRYGLKQGWTVGLVALWLMASPAVQAQDAPVYRCGNSYSAKPCPGGKPVDAADPRSAVQQTEARAAAQRDAALARQLKAERLADEKRVAKTGAANVGPAPAVAAKAAKPGTPKTTKKKRVKVVKLAKAPKPAKAGKAAAPR